MEATGSTLSKQTILIVDDEPLARKLLQHVFRSDYNVITAQDGEEGLYLARKLKPDLILTDNVMPKKSGIDLLLDIRSDVTIKDTTVVVVSSLSEAKHRVKGLEAGADDYIPKPYDIKEIKVKIDLLMLKKQYEKKLYKKNAQLNDALKELKETQAQLLHTSKLASIGELSAGIAHEINNPALAVNNALEIIDRKFHTLTNENGATKSTEQELKRFIEIAKDSLCRIRNIVDSLSTFTHKNREGVCAINLSENIESTLSILNHQISEDITIHNNYEQNCTIEADAQQLNQVFLNLIINSIHAIQHKQANSFYAGNVWISIARSHTETTIVIQDDGIGIPKKIQDKIFDPFFTTKDIGKGTGLGLDISYRIIQAHKGYINCASTENEGTIFTILLPNQQQHITALQA